MKQICTTHFLKQYDLLLSFDSDHVLSVKNQKSLQKLSYFVTALARVKYDNWGVS